MRDSAEKNSIDGTHKQFVGKERVTLMEIYITAFGTQTLLMMCKTKLSTKDLLMFLPDLARLTAINLSILITFKNTLAPDRKITHPHYPL